MITSGYQFMVKHISDQRTTLENVWKDVFAEDEPKKQSLIEISGHPGTGKSLLLHELIIRTTIPECYGGKQSEVIFLDLDHHFNIRILSKLLSYKMDVIFPSQLTYGKIKSLCFESIMHIPCYSSDHFEFVFEMINDILWDHKRVSLLAIYGLDTFYWEDSYYHLQRMVTHYKKALLRLRHLCGEHNICCAYTVDTNYLPKSGSFASNFLNSFIDYKFKLAEKADGKHFLNDKPIQINEGGIQFL